MTDEQLSLELMGGNLALRNAVLMDNMPLIKYMVYKHSDCSQDRLHDAIAYVTERLPYYTARKKLSTWMGWTALAGLFRGRMKSKREYRSPHVSLDAVKLYSTYSNPRNELMKKEYKEVRRTALKKALTNLSIPDQWAVRQHFLVGRTMTAIAEEDGISPQAVRQKLQRILKRMRRDVEHYADDLR